MECESARRIAEEEKKLLLITGATLHFKLSRRLPLPPGQAKNEDL